MSDTPTLLADFMEGRTLFLYINGMMEDPWIETSPTTLDKMLALNFGDREVWHKFVDLTDLDLATILVENFQESWHAMLNAALLSNSNSKRELIETVTQTDSRTNSSNETSKVSAFNSDTLIDDEGRQVSGTDGLESSRTRELLDETTDVKQKLVQLDYASRRNVVQSVLRDVASYLTIAIY